MKIPKVSVDRGENAKSTDAFIAGGGEGGEAKRRQVGKKRGGTPKVSARSSPAKSAFVGKKHRGTIVLSVPVRELLVAEAEKRGVTVSGLVESCIVATLGSPE